MDFQIPMIKSLTLQNFQSHRNSTFNFSKYFNCIQGPGHSGKTSVSRALNLLLYNQWDKSWVTFGQAHCVVIATLLDGTILTRTKGPKVNLYEITYPDSRYQKFENFGTAVPEEIQKLCKIFVVNLPGGDKVKLNLHSQFDPSFLQSLTSTNKAKLFGKLSGLDILDVVSQKLSLDRKRAKDEANSKEEELEQIVQKLGTFGNLSSYRSKLEVIQVQFEVVQQQIQRWHQLQTLKQRILDFKYQYSNISDQLSKVTFTDKIDLDQVSSKLDHMNQCRDLQGQISRWKRNLEILQSQMKKTDEQLEGTKRVYVDELQKSGVCPTCSEVITVECLHRVVQEL